MFLFAVSADHLHITIFFAAMDEVQEYKAYSEQAFFFACRTFSHGPLLTQPGFSGPMKCAVWGFELVYYLTLQAHWIDDIDNVIGPDNIPLALNQAFCASGFQMPVTEFFVRQYARAYQHWLDGGNPKETKDFVFSSQEVQDAYKKHIKEHGAKALLVAHLKKVERLNSQPLPVGRVLP